MSGLRSRKQAKDKLYYHVQRGFCLVIESQVDELMEFANSEGERLKQKCPTPCDADCEAECHEAHQPRHKQEQHSHPPDITHLLRNELRRSLGAQ